MPPPLLASLLLLCVLARAQSAPPPPAQLTLSSCAAPPPAALLWSFGGSGGGAGAFSLSGSAPALCATYDPATTNLVAAACVAGAASQLFTVRADGTLYHVQTELCWDAQYYGNATGTGLGLYGCTQEAWGRFSFNAAAGQITNTQLQTLCVNGAAFIPLPTPQQLAWTRYEVALMISYDMITQLPDVPNPQHFCIQAGGDSGFPVPPAALFNPSALDTDNWLDAARAADAKYTLLVASHCSGFLQWQSNVTLPDGSPYPYTVAQSAWREGKGDVVADYVASSRRAGMPFGFYLTWKSVRRAPCRAPSACTL